MPYIPVTRVENYCASGSEAFRGAVYAVASGACDIALALGVEKLKDTGYGGLPQRTRGAVSDLWWANFSAPGAFAQLASSYQARHGLSREDLKRAMAHVSVKSHDNGARNPKAHLRNRIDEERVLSAPVVAEPLGLLDCCGVSDGAACAIVTTPAIARSLGKRDPITVKALQLLSVFDERLAEAGRDDAIKVLVIRGAGRSFSAGYDLTRPADDTLEADRLRLQANLERWLRVRDLPKPVIAMIHGHCLAGATQLCVCCDVIFTAEDAKIGFPSIPAGAGLIAQTWMWHVGPHRAKYMSFLPNSQISGKDAEAFGFATRAFDPGALEEETYSYAARIAKVPASLLRIKKEAVNRVMDLNGFRAAIMYGAEWDSISHQTEGVREVRRMIDERGLRGAIQWYQDS